MDLRKRKEKKAEPIRFSRKSRAKPTSVLAELAPESLVTEPLAESLVTEPLAESLNEFEFELHLDSSELIEQKDVETEPLSPEPLPTESLDTKPLDTEPLATESLDTEVEFKPNETKHPRAKYRELLTLKSEAAIDLYIRQSNKFNLIKRYNEPVNCSLCNPNDDKHKMMSQYRHCSCKKCDLKYYFNLLERLV